MENKKPNPITIDNKETGKQYILDFTRATVRQAEKGGFDITEVTSKMASSVSDLFYYAFQAHHPNRLKKIDTDHILFDEMGGMSEELFSRLCELYAYTLESLYQTEENAKKSPWAVTL